jgi:hypothetical protein
MGGLKIELFTDAAGHCSDKRNNTQKHILIQLKKRRKSSDGAILSHSPWGWRSRALFFLLGKG